MTNDTTAQAFIERLRDKSFMEKMLPALADVSEGDWSRVVQLAQAEGYEFTEPELKAAIPDGFFKGRGQDPHAGWDRSTL